MPAIPPRPVVWLAQAILGGLDRLRRALLPPELYLLELTAFGAVRTHAVYTATRLGVFDALREAPLPTVELAERIGVEARLAARLLRALAGLGVLVRREGLWGLNGVSRLLLDGSGYAEGIRFNADPRQIAVWAALAEAMRGRTSAFERVHGAPFFDKLAAEPALGELFDRSMQAWAAPTVAAVQRAWRPPPGSTIIDVGGGQGHYLAALLAAEPRSRGVLVDRAPVLESAGPTLSAVHDRVRLEPGDFFEAVPSGGDIYLLANILHDWGDDDAARILRRVRAVLPPHGRIVVVDIVVPPGEPAHPGTLVDLMMMALFRDGCERTQAEFAALAASAGLALERCVPTASPASLLFLRAA